MVRRIKKFRRDKYGHIEGKNDVQDDNPFAALEEKQEKETEKEEIMEKEESTKQCVNKSIERDSDKGDEDQERTEVNLNNQEELVAGEMLTVKEEIIEQED